MKTQKSNLMWKTKKNVNMAVKKNSIRNIYMFIL